MATSDEITYLNEYVPNLPSQPKINNRSNRFLLMDYGFAFHDNRYDSVELFLNMTADNKTLEIH
jgi:hypothetical protein